MRSLYRPPKKTGPSVGVWAKKPRGHYMLRYTWVITLVLLVIIKYFVELLALNQVPQPLLHNAVNDINYASSRRLARHIFCLPLILMDGVDNVRLFSQRNVAPVHAGAAVAVDKGLCQLGHSVGEGFEALSAERAAKDAPPYRRPLCRSLHFARYRGPVINFHFCRRRRQRGYRNGFRSWGCQQSRVWLQRKLRS